MYSRRLVKVHRIVHNLHHVYNFQWNPTENRDGVRRYLTNTFAENLVVRDCVVAPLQIFAVWYVIFWASLIITSDFHISGVSPICSMILLKIYGSNCGVSFSSTIVISAIYRFSCCILIILDSCFQCVRGWWFYSCTLMYMSSHTVLICSE